MEKKQKRKVKNSVTGLSGLFLRKVSDEEKKIINAEFMSSVAPIGGVDFTDEKCLHTGTGYEACIYIFGYPAIVASYWLASLSVGNDTVTVIDITPTDTAEIKKNLRRSMEEQTSRAASAKTSGDYIDAQKQFEEIEAMYREVNGFGRVMKRMIARIYVAAMTKYDLEVAIKEIIKYLEGESFKAGICLNETKSDWRNLFLSYEQQQKEGIYRRRGQSILSKAIAGGQFFHFSALSDPNGTYYGVTPTGGSVFLDIFYKSRRRMSYNLAIMGKMGVGKSTLLKKILVERAMRGDKVRIFDVSGEFTDLVEYLGGKVIYLDGQGESIINILQILPDENNAIAYTKHIAKVTTIYKYLKSDNVSENELLILKQLLNFLYISKGIIDKKGNIIVNLTELPAEKFPVLSDLLELTRVILNNFSKFEQQFLSASDLKGVIRGSMRSVIDTIELKLVDLCTTYKNVFDGSTRIRNFYEEKIVCFNVTALADMEDAVYDAQVYNALSVCWDNAIESGSRMLHMFEHDEIAWEDIIHTLVLIDEAHTMINANKLAGVSEIEQMMRQGRKYFGGIGLASQSVRDFVPDDAASEAVAKIKKLFELTTYKFVMNHDASTIPKLREVFQSAFTEDEIERISTLEGRSCILSAGIEKLEFEIWAEPVVLELGSGGA